MHDALSKIGFAAFLAVTPAMWASASDFPVTVDSCGQPVTFTSPPARAVINDLNMAEMALRCICRTVLSVSPASVAGTR